MDLNFDCQIVSSLSNPKCFLAKYCSLIPIEKEDDFLSHSRLKTGNSFNQYLTITLSLKLTIEIHDWKLEQNTFGSSNFYNLTS